MAIKFNNISYSGFFYNGEALTAMYLNGNKVYGSESQPITITPVEWISNENINLGTIDLGYTIKTNTKMQFKVEYVTKIGDCLIGEENTNSTNNYKWFSFGSRMYYDINTQRLDPVWSATSGEFELGNYYIKNLATGSNMASGSSWSGTRTSTLRIFKPRSQGEDKARFYYFKIYEGDTLVMDLIPVLDMNNIPCFFDKVGKHFYYYKVNGVPSTGLTYGSTVTVYDWVSNGGVTSSSNWARINIDYFWKTNSRAELTFKVLRASSGYIFADDGGSTPVRLSSVKNSLWFQYHRAVVTANRDWSNIQNIEMGNFYLKDLDTDSVIVTGTTQTGDETVTMYLWGTIDKSQIYSIKIYEGDTLVRDLIPALLSDNRKGLWDKQRNLFYGDVYNHTDSLFLGDNGQTLVIPVI